jgi:hypothetical protein
VKYWSYFAVKLALAAGIMRAVWQLMFLLLPEPETFLRQKVSRFPQDLSWTTAFLLWWLLSIALIFLVVWDQRRRCRECLRLLRMPVEHGNWGLALLFAPPRMERICPFGHGTLEEPEVHVSSTQGAEWRRHGDMWEELDELESRRR